MSNLVYERDSLGAYCIRQFPPFQFSHHHDEIIRVLTEVVHGENKRVIVSCPPRHGKSMIVSEYFPPWYLGHHPDRCIAVASYGQTLSEKFGRSVKGQVQTEFFQSAFPECKIKSDACTSRLIETTTRGAYLATSIGGSLTGHGANLLLIDDPVKDRQEAESETIRDNAWDWYTSTARTRVMKGGSIIVVLTRWHEDDLAGRILANDTDGEWEYIRFPAIDENNEALWPEMYDLQALLDIRRDIGPYDFQALYQNDPKPMDGGLLKVKNVQYVNQYPEFSRVIQIVDSAIKEGQQNDYSVITTLGLAGTGIYHINTWRDKVQYPDLKRAVHANYKSFRPSVVVVEDKASGQQLIQELGSKLPIKPAKAVTDKVERAGTLADVMDVGRIYMKEGEAINNTIISEMASFPNGSHDDIVDTWAYGAQELIRSEIRPMFGDLFEDQHIIEGNTPPPHGWARFRSLCWSPMEHPAVIWWMVANDDKEYAGRWYDPGDIIVYAEKAWTRLMQPAELADEIRQFENQESLAGTRAGPAGGNGDVEIWLDREPGSASVVFAEKNVGFIRAFPDPKTGWAQIRSRLYMKTLFVNERCSTLVDQLRYTTADTTDRENVEAGQAIGSVSSLRFACNSFQKKPKAVNESVDVDAVVKSVFRRGR